MRTTMLDTMLNRRSVAQLHRLHNNGGADARESDAWRQAAQPTDGRGCWSRVQLT